MFSVIFESASAAFCDFPSVKIPIPIPIATAQTIPIASWPSPTSALITAATKSIIIIGSIIASLMLSHMDPLSCLVNSLGPYFSSLALISELDNPVLLSTLSSSRTFEPCSLKYFILSTFL